MNAQTEYNTVEWSEVQPLRKLYVELGRTYYQQQNFDKAVEALEQAMQIKDSSVEDWKIYKLLFDACRQNGDQQKADENLLKVLATAPAPIAEEIMRHEKVETSNLQPVSAGKVKEEVLVLQGKAHLLMEDGKRTEALKLLKKALDKATTTDNSEIEKAVLLDMAEVWVEEDSGDAAIEILQNVEVTENKELKIRQQVLLGRTYLLLQKTDAAIAIADNILAEHTNHLAAGILKVQALIVALQFKDALTLVHHLMANHTVTDELLFYKVEVLLEGNINIEEAAKLLVELKEKSGIQFIKTKLCQTHIRFRPQHGNDNFFVAQVYNILSDDF